MLHSGYFQEDYLNQVPKTEPTARKINSKPFIYSIIQLKDSIRAICIKFYLIYA